MDFINRPERSPANVTHHTFYSQIYRHDLGYNIYLPPDYEKSGEACPIAYHFHGWTGNESSEIYTMEKVYQNRQTITVFPNSSPVIEDFENLPVEEMIINELMPHIRREYRTATTRESISASGFSMGGGFAFYQAIKHPELFGSVTAYAGTYHHYLHKGSCTVEQPPGKAAGLYEAMMKEERYLEENNILCVVQQNAGDIRGKIHLKIHIGFNDPLFCENEIVHMYLNSLDIPHAYYVFEGAGHELAAIL